MAFAERAGSHRGRDRSGGGGTREHGRPSLRRRRGHWYPAVLAGGQRGLVPRHHRPDALALLQHRREPADLFVRHAAFSPSVLPSCRFRGLVFRVPLGRIAPIGEPASGVRRGPRAPASLGPSARRGGPGSTPASLGVPPTPRGSGSRGTSPSVRNGRPPNRSCRPGPPSGRQAPGSPSAPGSSPLPPTYPPRHTPRRSPRR